jgi:hypothetical protein
MSTTNIARLATTGSNVFTGALTGTSATFTSDITINAAATNGLILQNIAGGESPNVSFITPVNKYNIDANAVGNLRFFTENTDGSGGVVRANFDASGNLGLGVTDLGPSGVSLSTNFNYSWSEGSGNAYAVLFRQRNSAATVVASGYKRSSTGPFASSYGISMARAAIAVGYNNGSIAFFSDAATNVANGTDITPTEKMTLNSSGNLTVTGTINGISIPNDLFAQQFLLMGS